jgi:hypothetical protein
MAFDFLSGIYSMFLKDRFEEIKDHSEQASDIQSEILSDILREASDTEWGIRHDFKTIYSYQEFRERLPIQKMSDLQPYLERTRNGEQNLLWPGVPVEVLDSMNNTRIPLSLQAIQEIFLQGIADSYAIYLSCCPESKLFEGFSANVGHGNECPYMNPLYALLRENEPFLSSLLNLPKRVGLDKEGNPSIELILRETQGQKISSFRGSPERLKVLFEAARKKKGASNDDDLWPEAEILFHRSPTTTAELLAAQTLLPKGIKQQASYCSPEGLFGIQNDPNDPAFLLMLDLSTFYEFMPIDGDTSQIIPLEDVEMGINYRMVVTNCSGLWRCCSEGPALRFVSRSPYRFTLH